MSLELEEEQRAVLTRTESRATASAYRLRNVFNAVKHCKPERKAPSKLPAISASRLAASKQEHDDSKTKLYLAYGSNLCDETFRGKRGIRPLASLNVVVPTLRMTFDLPGIPYVEPCFANSATRDPTVPPTKPEYAPQEYNKDKWKKGMVGVVYEVTLEDYTHIIATEGGGASYKDVLVECFPLAEGGDDVPTVPRSSAFLTHTLFAPAVPPDDPEHHDGRFSRPDPSYAQPSARYLYLITSGAEERGLPQEYKDYLYAIRPYEARGRKTQLGSFIFQAMWLPFLLLLFQIMQQFQDKDGKLPLWAAKILAAFFGAVWTSYDDFFKPVFGDGERTDYTKKRHAAEREARFSSAEQEKTSVAQRYALSSEKC